MAARPVVPTAAQLRAAEAGCDRFIAGHGRRTAERFLATIPVDAELDVYGDGGVVAALEADVATLLEKPAALFLPSGTMAQQATLRIHADARGRRSVVFHPTCHLDTSEERAYERLHGLVGIPVGPATEPLTIERLKAVREPFGSLVLELPQRALGGTLPSFAELDAMCQWARRRGAAVHLDGARLFEAAPYYQATAKASIAKVAALFDTVYVSFYKGLGGIAGSCVAGSKEVIGELSAWRTRHGGRLFGLWPYAASARTVLAERQPKMGAYYRRAKAIGAALGALEGVEVLPTPVQSPLLHIRIAGERAVIARRMYDLATERGIWSFARPFMTEGPALQRFEMTVGDATMALSVDEVVDAFTWIAHGH